jgi:hypothetical protein
MVGLTDSFLFYFIWFKDITCLCKRCGIPDKQELYVRHLYSCLGVEESGQTLVVWLLLWKIWQHP